MAINTQSFMLDISKKPAGMKTLYLAQGDHNGTTVRVTVKDDGAPLNLSGYDVYWAMLLPDDNTFYREKGSASGNVATVTIDERFAASVPGTTSVAYLEIRKGDDLIASTERINVVISASAETGVTEAKSWDSFVQTWLDGLHELWDQQDAAFKQSEAARSASENIRTQAESKRVEAEKARAAAEGDREDAEGKRAEAEKRRAEAEGKRAAAEDARAKAEKERVSAEEGRRSAESSRDAAEEGRSSAESQRAASEETRNEAESARDQAEASRSSAEDARAAAESARAGSEEARASAESARDQAESLRAQAESGRESSEGGRAAAEVQRAAAEDARVSSESGRAEAETAREAAESDRSASEGERASAESARAAAEAQRVAEFDEMKQRSNGWTIYVCGEDEYDPETRRPAVDDPEAGKLYMVPLENQTDDNRYEEWQWLGGSWERHGVTMLTVEAVTAARINRILSGETLTGNDLLTATGLSYLLAAMQASDDDIDEILEGLDEL